MLTGLDELVVDRLGDAEAAGRVFTVDHDAIELPVANETGQALCDDGAPAAADHIADEQNAHSLTPSDAARRDPLPPRGGGLGRGVTEPRRRRERHPPPDRLRRSASPLRRKVKFDSLA
jgi:hypothetical protein